MPFFIKTTNGEHGPVSFDDLKKMADNGKLKPKHLVRSDDAENYVPAGKLKGIFPQEEPAEETTVAGEIRDIGAGAIKVAGNVAGAIGSLIPQRKPAEPVTIREKAVAVLNEGLDALIKDGQDAGLTGKILDKMRQFLTANETILYIASQKRPVVTFFPDSIVLTNRRFMIVRPKMLGRLDMTDFIWRDLKNVQIEENFIGATIHVTTTADVKDSLDYLPKLQARAIYRIAQEGEERVIDERRDRMMEESRAAAGQVVVQTSVTPVATVAPTPTLGDEVAAKLQRLKSLLDAGLIEPSEYAEKKASIIASI